jgi:hypothetical protein
VGQGGAIGGQVAQSDAANAMQSQLANQGMDFNTWQQMMNTVSPMAFAAPWQGMAGMADLVNMNNQIPLGLMEQAINAWFTDRGVQAQEDAASGSGGGALGGLLSGLGSIIGAIGGPGGSAAGAAIGKAGATGFTGKPPSLGIDYSSIGGRQAPPNIFPGPGVSLMDIDPTTFSTAPTTELGPAYDPWSSVPPEFARTGPSEEEAIMERLLRGLSENPWDRPFGAEALY